MTEVSSGSKKRDIPLWLGILLVVAGITVAGWFIWSQVSGFWTGDSGVFTIEGVDPGVAPRGQQRRAPQPPRPISAVRQLNENTWMTRSGMYSLRVRKDGEKYNYTASAFAMNLLPRDAQWVLVAVPRLNPAQATKIGLNEDQVKRFKALPTSPTFSLALDDAAKQKLDAAFRKFVAAPAENKGGTDTELTKTLEQVATPVAKQQEANVKAAYDTYQKSIKPEQWQQLRQLGTGPAPTTQNN